MDVFIKLCKKNNVVIKLVYGFIYFNLLGCVGPLNSYLVIEVKDHIKDGRSSEKSIKTSKTPLQNSFLTEPLPLVDFEPIPVKGEDRFTIYAEVRTDSLPPKTFYVIPVMLNVPHSKDVEFQALALINERKNRLILSFHVISDSKLIQHAFESLVKEGLNPEKVMFYPLNDLNPKFSITTMDSDFGVSSHASAIYSQDYPLSTLIILQSTGRENVKSTLGAIGKAGGLKGFLYSSMLVKTKAGKKKVFRKAITIDVYNLGISGLIN